MIKEYLYDGTFEGLLTSVYDAYYKRDHPQDIIPYKEKENNFLIEYIYIETDMDKYDKVYHAIDQKISSEVLRIIFYCHLSEIPKSGKLILEYIRLGFKIGYKINEHLANDTVRSIDNIYKKVSRERHRMLGLIRFKEMENKILYASIEPDYNIITLIATHFARRMRGENWIIHDLKRNIALIYSQGEWNIRDLDMIDSIIIKESEVEYQNLWKTYFSSIAIEGKINPQLQKNNMPKRYWKHLIEK